MRMDSFLQRLLEQPTPAEPRSRGGDGPRRRVDDQVPAPQPAEAAGPARQGFQAPLSPASAPGVVTTRAAASPSPGIAPSAAEVTFGTTTTGATHAAGAADHAAAVPARATVAGDTFQGSGAPRIAIYDTLTSPPRVLTVEKEDLPQLISALATETYRSCREQGGEVPYMVIRELIENLIHASFRDVVVTVLQAGRVIRISDHGPGIVDKERAFEPGFTTATPDQRRIIRGVGSGLPIAREALAFMQGVLTVEDNLGGGTVLTVTLPERPAATAVPEPGREAPKLTTRQKRILVLLMELGSAGPTAIGKELGIAPATAYRDLGLLRDLGLIDSVGEGKRALTDEGVSVLDSIL